MHVYLATVHLYHVSTPVPSTLGSSVKIMDGRMDWEKNYILTQNKRNFLTASAKMSYLKYWV